MPRKKKSRPLTLLDDADDGGGAAGGGDDVLGKNEAWAAKYEERKRRQALAQARERGWDLSGALDAGDSDSSTSESEDEDGRELTPRKEAQALRVIQLLRSRDPAVYDPAAKFYDDGDSDDDSDSDDEAGEDDGRDGDAGGGAGGATAADGDGTDKDKDKAKAKADKKHKKEKKLTAKDVIREQILEAAKTGKADAFDEDSDGDEGRMTRVVDTAKVAQLEYDDEQRRLRREFAAAAEGGGSGDDGGDGDGDGSSASGDDSDGSGDDESGGLLKIKERVTRPPVSVPVEPTVDPNDRFLLDFVLNRRWLGEGGYTEQGVPDDDVDEEALDAADQFEAKYNFRFEEEGATQIVGHARVIEDSVRRKPEKRKQEREKRRVRKMKEQEEEEREIRRLKNLKRAELKARLEKIQEVAGAKAELDKFADTLDGDFDPDEHDRRMQQVFNDEYYDDDEDATPEDIMAGLDEDLGDKFAGSDSDGESAAVGHGGGGGGGGGGGKHRRGHAADAGADVEEHEEMLKLHAEGKAGGVRTRFPYRKVAPADYGLEAIDILGVDDKLLNQYVSLKKLAPYRDTEWSIKADKRKKVLKKLREENELLKRADAVAAAVAGNGSTAAGGSKHKDKHGKVSKKRKAPADEPADEPADGDDADAVPAAKPEASGGADAEDAGDAKKTRRRKKKKKRAKTAGGGGADA